MNLSYYLVSLPSSPTLPGIFGGFSALYYTGICVLRWLSCGYEVRLGSAFT